jgi:hypothetical protein
MPATRPGVPRPTLDLNFPMSLGVFEKYEEAQRAVDYLSDEEFPVQNCMIVGTELKQVERVTGRLTYARAAMAGAASGAWMGLFVGVLLSLFSPTESAFGIIIAGVLFGIVFGVVLGLVGYAATRGRRDFTSVSQVVATRYEVLVEHNLLERAQMLLLKMPADKPL